MCMRPDLKLQLCKSKVHVEFLQFQRVSGNLILAACFIPLHLPGQYIQPLSLHHQDRPF